MQPKGTSLEGFLWPATYRVLPDTTAEELVRLMLDGFVANVGEDRLDVPKERGLTFYQVLTLASIVEREAVLDEERPHDRRRLPAPDGRLQGHRADPELGPDGLLRHRHDGARRR